MKQRESLSEAVTVAPGSSPVVAGPRVHFIAGERPKFTDETAGLLRRRLSAATLILFGVLAASFLGNLITGEFTVWWLRAAILVIVLGCLLSLRSPRPLTLRTLRVFELTVFG